MPFFNIHTNIKLNGAAKEKFLIEAVYFMAEELKKPRERVIVNYMYNPDMLFGLYREDIGALVEVKSIGFPSDREKMAVKFTNFLHGQLGADIEHIEIEFIDMPASTISIAGKLRG